MSLRLPLALRTWGRSSSISSRDSSGSMPPNKGNVPAVIAHIQQETPTVKRFTLEPVVGGAEPPQLRFLPGQWVDLFIPGVHTVGGFSFTSTPRQLEKEGSFELAVKRSTHPPAAWLHNKARVGDCVSVHVGGSFRYLPGDEHRPLLLVAGGIGITPLFSILKHVCELQDSRHSGSSSSSGTGSGADGSVGRDRKSVV